MNTNLGSNMQTVAIDRFSGFSELYNNARPNPPKKACEIITNLLNTEKIGMVVDLGCGTGLSTKIWKEYANNIIGIEPNNDMRNEAIKNNSDIKFIDGNSYNTGLPDNSSDVVICSQSFHWMDPILSIQEINRILKLNGMLAILDCDWPVTISKNAEIAYNELFQSVNLYHSKYSDELPKERQWPKNKHLENVINSGYFTYCKKIYFENIETCSSERFINIALSQGHLQTLVKNGISEIYTDIRKFKNTVVNDIKSEKKMYISYQMIIAIK